MLGLWPTLGLCSAQASIVEQVGSSSTPNGDDEQAPKAKETMAMLSNRRIFFIGFLICKASSRG